MGWSLTQTSPPASTPVTLAEAKTHLRVDTSDDDALITAQIEAATRWVEEYTGRQLVDATWKLTLDTWPVGDEIQLARPPVGSVTSIVYTKSDGTTDTMPSADYFLDNADDYGPHRVVLSDGKSWPSEQLRPAAAVAVTYTAGYGAAGDVPDQFKTAVKTVVGTLYEHRETEVVGTISTALKHSAEWLLFPFRVGWF